MPNRGTQATVHGPVKLTGEPDLRYKTNEQEGTAAYDSRHRNPHQGQPPPQRQRHDRPMGDGDDIVNADGTLDMRFLENRIKAGLVEDPEGERAAARTAEPDLPAKQRKGHRRH
jgi:hypothetical protein